LFGVHSLQSGFVSGALVAANLFGIADKAPPTDLRTHRICERGDVLMTPKPKGKWGGARPESGRKRKPKHEKQAPAASDEIVIARWMKFGPEKFSADLLVRAVLDIQAQFDRGFPASRKLKCSRSP
jgi:hypothetical protein